MGYGLPRCGRRMEREKVSQVSFTLHFGFEIDWTYWALAFGVGQPLHDSTNIGANVRIGPFTFDVTVSR